MMVNKNEVIQYVNKLIKQVTHIQEELEKNVEFELTRTKDALLRGTENERILQQREKRIERLESCLYHNRKERVG